MKILFIHNSYSKPSGEEHASQGLADLLVENGHQISWFRRSSSEIGDSKLKMIKSFFTAVYNPLAIKEVKKKIIEVKPDVVQIQNVYPFISPFVFKAIKRMGIPIVMRCPNYRLFCPNGLFLDTDGNVCEKCIGNLKEAWCVLKNCESSRVKSIGYALRNMVARKKRLMFDHVDAFIVQSDFQKKRFVELGISNDKLHIVHGLTPKLCVEDAGIIGDKITFVGRASFEKGIYEFIEVAKFFPNIHFVVAGSIDSSIIELVNQSPNNVEWMGFLGSSDLDNLYQNSRIIVIPSKWYEGFPNVITRAMIHGKPVITTNLGAMASIIDDKVNGLLIASGSVSELSDAISKLYNNIDMCVQMGRNGKKKALTEYSSESIYDRLISIYQELV